MTETKLFHISDVLSITTGRLVSYRHMEGVYAILGWMTGESLFTHQLPRAMRECLPEILRQFPVLAEVRLPADPASLGNIDVRHDWIDSVRKNLSLGSHLAIAPLPEREPQYDTPIADAVEMMGDPTKVLVIDND